ncbi:hypothetical protein GH733_000644 [Mirounga leonina]|nr:hypothetical protein GH733_000644 [Mirounga leonina]
MLCHQHTSATGFPGPTCCFRPGLEVNYATLDSCICHGGLLKVAGFRATAAAQCGPRWHIDLQPWAGPAQSLDEEVLRFLRYISTPQVVFQAQLGPKCSLLPEFAKAQIACNHMSTDSLTTDSSPAKKPWSVCLDDRFGLAHQIRSKQCRLYSLGLGSDDTQFEVSMANNGCEVHRFDPSVKSAHILESQRLWYHRLSIDWRDPHPAVAAQKPHSNTRKLGTILNEFGHHKSEMACDLEHAKMGKIYQISLEIDNRT